MHKNDHRHDQIRRREVTIAIILLAMVSACSPRGSARAFDTAGWEWVAPSDVTWAPYTSKNRGSICLVAGGQDEAAMKEAVLADPPVPQKFTSSTPIVAVHSLCFSPDCHRNVNLSLNADDLAFATSAHWEEVVLEEGIGCSYVCRRYWATLELGRLSEGRHTITFAGDELTLEVPGRQRACLGASPFGRNDVKHGEGEPAN